MEKDKVFEENKSLKLYYRTSDGKAFYDECNAKLHARTLEDKSVEMVSSDQPSTNEAGKVPITGETGQVIGGSKGEQIPDETPTTEEVRVSSETQIADEEKEVEDGKGSGDGK